jgi:ribosomal protein L32
VGRRWRAQNHEAYLESQRRYREQNREARNEQARRYWEQNREAISAKRAAYYEQNREAISEKFRRYRDQKIAEGRCAKCGQIAISETLCWDCLTKDEERRTLALR